MSTVSFAGFSRVAGVLKFRTAGDVKRIDQLRKLGDTDVVILALPTDMSKNDAAKYVLTEVGSGAYMVDVKEAEALLTSVIKDENPFAKPKAAKKPRTVKVNKPRLIIGSVSVGADDAPYSPKQAAKIRAEFMKKLNAAYEAN